MNGKSLYHFSMSNFKMNTVQKDYFDNLEDEYQIKEL